MSSRQLDKVLAILARQKAEDGTASFDESRGLMAERCARWSVPIGQQQGIAHPLATAHVEVEVSRLATMQAAELYDAGDPGVAEAANIAKYVGAEAALNSLDQSIQTHGGNGLAHEYGLSELWFVTRLMRTAPVSREMVLNFIAQTSLGLPRSY